MNMSDHECMEKMLILWERLHSTPVENSLDEFLEEFDRIVKSYIIYYNL